MHPDKFLGRNGKSIKPRISDGEKAERLAQLGAVISGKRKEAVDARKASGIESVWLACEEAYLGIDDMNRHEYAEARWAKPTSMIGPLTSNRIVQDDARSNAYVRLTSRYVDNAAAKIGEILLPIDDKAFSIEPTPDPDLVKQMEDLTPLIDQATGSQIMRPLKDDEEPPTPIEVQPNQPNPPIPGGATAQPPMVPATVSDQAQELMDKAQDCAEKAETRIYDWMVESKYPAEMRKVIHDAARIGVGILKGPFPEIKKSKALTKNKNQIAIQIQKKVYPAVRWVDPWNIFPDDACGEDIHNGDYIFERDFLSTKLLKKLKEQDGYLSGQIEQVIEEGPGKMYADGGSPQDKKNRKRYEIWYYYGVLTREELDLADTVGLEDLPEDQDEIHAIVSLVNDTVIRAIINPLDSGSFPYRVMGWSRRPGCWAGVGVGEAMDMPQRMCNASTRALLNNAGLSAGPQIIIDQLGIIPADGSWRLTPNKIWYKTGEAATDDVRDAFLAVIIPSVQKEMMAVIEYSMKLAEESTGIPLITQGQTGPTTPDTFGAAELQDNNAHTWLRSIGFRFDDQITDPLVNDYYEWLLLDPDVPDDEKGDFQINAHGSIAMVERAIQEQTLMGLFQLSANPAYKLNPEKLCEEYLKAKRLDPRKIQYTPEEQQQMDKNPQTPLPLAIEQIKGQNAMQLQQAKTQGELQQIAQESAQEQQALQNGGTTPHMAAAMARVEQEKIRAVTAQSVETSRANAELARAEKEREIAQQNGQFDIAKLQMQERLAILDYTAKHNLTIEQVHAQLQNTALQEQTKRQLAAAELDLAQSEGHKDRILDLHKHQTSLIKDQVSTPNTP